MRKKVKIFKVGEMLSSFDVQFLTPIPQGPQPPTPDSILRYNPIITMRKLSATWDDEEVVLHGQIENDFLKEWAEHVVRPTAGDRRIVNRIEVVEAAAAK